jgi:hypothetical protein
MKQNFICLKNTIVISSIPLHILTAVLMMAWYEPETHGHIMKKIIHFIKNL